MDKYKHETSDKPIFSSDQAVVDSVRCLYTANPFARTSLLSLQETGVLTALKAHTSERSGLESYLFFIVENGKGSLLYGGKQYELNTGDCVMINCRQNYAHSTSDDLWTIRWVHFTGPSMPMIYNKYLERGGRPAFRPEQTFKQYRSILKQIYDTAMSDSYVRDMEINTLLSEMLTILMKDAWNPVNEDDNQNRSDISAIKTYLDLHSSEKITLDELSEQFFLEKTYLSRLFKDTYGTSPIDYVIQNRITNAKTKLRFTDMTIEEIAYACGFNSATYFARIFRKIENMSPREYRELW